VSDNPTKQTTIRPLGRWHRWWLAQFKEAYAKRSIEYRHSGGIAVHGYEGTAQGRALAGLMQRGLIAYEMAFEGGLTVLRITEKGLAT
jgi:hypothetical protein